MMNRRDFVLHQISKESRVLEIGPLNQPVVRKDVYPKTYYCDIRSTEEVKRLYRASSYLEKTSLTVQLDSIVDIDYVLKGSYRETFAAVEPFDAFVACHVIEHIPDILGFFADIPSVLKPGSKLLLTYPDRRYCFDHFRFGTSFRDAYDVYRGGVSRTARLAMDFFYSSIAENDPAVFWDEAKCAGLSPDGRFDAAKTRYDEVSNSQVVDDAHYWIFSDLEFLQFLYDGTRAGLIPFRFLSFYPTEKDRQEFYVALEYDPSVLSDCGETLRDLRAAMLANSDRAQYLKAISVFSEQERDIARLESEVNAMQSSASWRLTAPIRHIADCLKGKKTK